MRWPPGRGPARRRRTSGDTHRGGPGTEASHRRYRSTASGVEDPSRGQLPETELVHDLSRLLLVEVISHLGLASGKRPQSGGRQSGQVRQRLEARDQAVATEQRHEPWQSGGGQCRARGEIGMHAKRAEIAEARAVGPKERGSSASSVGAPASQVSSSADFSCRRSSSAPRGSRWAKLTPDCAAFGDTVKRGRPLLTGRELQGVGEAGAGYVRR